MIQRRDGPEVLEHPRVSAGVDADEDGVRDAVASRNVGVDASADGDGSRADPAALKRSLLLQGVSSSSVTSSVSPTDSSSASASASYDGQESETSSQMDAASPLPSSPLHLHSERTRLRARPATVVTTDNPPPASGTDEYGNPHRRRDARSCDDHGSDRAAAPEQPQASGSDTASPTRTADDTSRPRRTRPARPAPSPPVLDSAPSQDGNRPPPQRRQRPKRTGPRTGKPKRSVAILIVDADKTPYQNRPAAQAHPE